MHDMVEDAAMAINHALKPAPGAISRGATGTSGLALPQVS